MNSTYAKGGWINLHMQKKVGMNSSNQNVAGTKLHK